MNYLEIIARKYQKARQLKKDGGWRALENHLKRRFVGFREMKNYRQWIRHREINEEKRREIRRRIEKLNYRPLFSIVMPVYNVEEKWLRRCLESALGQLYENWELCIADDHSPAPHIKKVLREYAARDK